MDKDSALKQIMSQLRVDSATAEKIVKKSKEGGEFSDNIDTWVNQRFLPHCVFIDEVGYTKMCVNALKILNKTAANDYGSSRQRDMGQLWADMTRGYLGEYAFKQFLREQWNIDAKLGHESGSLHEYLFTDIHEIRKSSSEEYCVPGLKISIKTSKWNGIWLDIPGDQFSHSDVYVFVKVGTGRDHLFAFFKHISVFKDKVLKRGEEIGLLNSDESAQLYDSLPTFAPIPAYICGFIPRNVDYQNLSYMGKKGRKHFTITSWNGPINPGDLDKIRQKEDVSGNVKFSGIGQFSHDKGYLFNIGSLLWKNEDWMKMIEKL